jgi:PAS domain S-box-containing protein
MTESSGYVLEPLREGADFTLYRGRQHGASSPVLAVALAAQQTSAECFHQLEHEYSLATELDPAWAAKPLTLTRHEGRPLLILSDPGAEPLDRVIERNHGRPFDLTSFLQVAVGVAKALGQVHRQGLIHRDIKPENMLVDEAGNVWLTGFGIAWQLPTGRQAPVAPEIIAGTLAYMAPEQTGRMNRSMDARSDLYSLGVTFYQMLTGRLPFAAADPLEWIHCHIARRPIPPGDCAAVPEVLSCLTLKLLAKNAEERYQTAAGLESDLRRCMAEWEMLGRIDTFPLGAQDVPDRLLIPEKLYGREREIDALLAAFDRVVTDGTAELVLVSGYSGIGKSSVVNELHKALVPLRGLFAAGKFDQYKRDIPYTTLAQAFQTLIRQILVKNEAEVEAWRGALAEAVGPNGQLIVDLIPEVEFILGKQPPVPELPPRDAQNRFQMVFRRFLGAFATREHPLVLFLDDLQWLDTATLELLERLMTDPDLRHLMLVGAYRDNEVSSSHPLMQTLDIVLKAGARVEEIVLTTLGLGDVRKLVADAVHCDLERALPLALLVQEKTGGNPFFTIQFVRTLEEEGLLSFDPITRAWQWDIDRIRAESYTDNVVELMAEKLERLSDTTQEALKQLACLGNVAEVATLAAVRGATEEATHAALRDAVRAGLVFQQESTYRFLHDRIQQAAYSLIPEGQRAEVHLRIGRVLLASLSADELGEQLFEVANQFNRGTGLLHDRKEKAEVARINLRTGRKAKASAAYASAHMYFSAGMDLLDESDWDSQYELTFSLWLERAECEFLTGNFDTAEQLIGELLGRGASRIDQASTYNLKVLVHTLKSENAQAVDSALTCLRLFGIDIPTRPTWEQVQAEYERVWQALDGRPIESLIDLPLMTDPELQAAMLLLSTLLASAYVANFHLFCLLVCQMVNISMQHGTSGASALGFGWLGTVLGPVFHRYSEGYRFGKLACDLVDKHGFIASKAKVYFTMGIVALWTQPITTAIDYMQETFRTAIETGDVAFACYSTDHALTDLLLRNDPLDTVGREVERGLEFVRKAKFFEVADFIQTEQRFIATMQGTTTAFSSSSEGQFDEAAFEAQLIANQATTTACWYWIVKLKTRFLLGNYAEAFAAAEKAKLYLSSSAVHFQLLDYFYYTALTVAALYENASADEQMGWRDLLTAHREQLREWSENYPPTFSDKHALVSAEIAQLEGRDGDAMRFYEDAIRAAREHGFVQNEALAHEVAARFYARGGFETIAHAYLRNARNCYERWGAIGKVKQLDECYSQLHEERVATSTTAMIGKPVSQLDVETVVRASQALSSEIVLPKLIEKLMRIAVEHAGAERGLLILLREEEPRIEADAVTGHSMVQVTVQPRAITPLDLPKSALQYVIRTRERVALDDASVRNLYSEDEYVQQKRPRSLLCLPIVKQTRLIGALYLENNLTARAFTDDRVAVLDMLASQAANSLENALIYSDLQRSEAYLAQGQSLSHTGSFGRNITNGEIYWSEESYKIFEHDRSVKPTLESVISRIHSEDREQVRQTIDRATKERKDFDLEYRLLKPDGSVKHLRVLARAVETSFGDFEYVGAVTDVSAARQAEVTLRESEAYLAEAQRLSRTGSWAWNPVTGKNRYWSDECFRILGFDPADGIPPREEFVQRIHPGDRPIVAEKLETTVRERGEYEVDYRVIHPGGEIRNIHAIGHPVLGPSGDLVEIVGTAIDVTERKQAEEERERLRQAQVDLAHANRVTTMGELTASVAHEVSQPIAASLTNANTCLRWLAGESPNIEEAREAAQRIVKDQTRAGEIISRIRLMFKRMTPQRDLVDINEVIREMIVLLRAETTRCLISLRTELVADLPLVMGDRVQLQQVLMNLTMNGIDAMADVDGTRELVIHSQLADDGQLMVTISDTGVGLPPELAKHIFDAFFTTKPHGTGLGLRISRSIIESHGGCLWAGENIPRGARFHFTLPSAKAQV